MADLLIVLAFAVPGLLVAGLAFAADRWARKRRDEVLASWGRVRGS